MGEVIGVTWGTREQAEARLALFDEETAEMDGVYVVDPHTFSGIHDIIPAFEMAVAPIRWYTPDNVISAGHVANFRDSGILMQPVKLSAELWDAIRDGAQEAYPAEFAALDEQSQQAFALGWAAVNGVLPDESLSRIALPE